jgi:hypothetical protein
MSEETLHVPAYKNSAKYDEFHLTVETTFLTYGMGKFTIIIVLYFTGLAQMNH